MDEKQLKKLAVISVVFMIVVGICGCIVNSCYYHTEKTSSRNAEIEKQQENSQKGIQQILDETVTKIKTDTSLKNAIWIENKEEVEKKLGNHYIKIRKTEQNQNNIEVVEEAEPKKITILFQSTQSEKKVEDIDITSVSWVSDGVEYYYNKSDTEHPGTIQDITIKNNLETVSTANNIPKKMLEIANAGRKELPEEIQYEIEMQLNDTYGYELYMDQNYIYITLCPLREYYEHIVVVDTGHGGEDTGSYAAFGEMTEEDYNLAIVKKLREYLNKEEKIKVFYTRLTDKEVPLESRVGLANSLNADLFLSVHCNSNEETPKANGIEVLYQNKGVVQESSKKFAKVILDNLIEKTERRKRSILKGNEIYIIRNANVPVALAEVGFLNNTSDLSFLQSEEGQNAIAEGLYEGILEMLSQ